jgi:Arc/MetJ family transcription regulator
MRTNIEIDSKLINKARKLTRLKTKKQVVNFALANLVKTINKKQMLGFYGKVKWEGKLSDMRK